SKFIGVMVSSKSGIESTGGDITITGTAGNGGAGNHGIFITGTSVVKTAGAGSITITGTGANTTSSAGVAIKTTSLIETENGGILIDGTATSNVVGQGASNLGIDINGSTVRIIGVTGSGDLIVLGTGSGRLDKNLGVSVVKSTLSVAGSGKVGLTGVASALGGSSNTGVKVLGGSIVSTNTGDIEFTGTAGGTGKNNYGVWVSGTTLSSTGGSFRVTGQGSLSGALDGNIGITIQKVTANIGGDIELTGTSGTGTKNNHGVILNAVTLSAGGLLDILGISSSVLPLGLNNNVGVYLTNATSLTGAAGSSIVGTGGQGTAKNHGIYASGNTVIGGGLTAGDFVGTAGSGTGSLPEAGTFAF
ncbi:MAG: hypothetical protein JNK37_17700, partial [Verrucomicrobiales bacterium]|nr:hypothetical protein [Verrucomicrobiales bacterium]